MESLLEAVHQAHSVDPGCLMEAPGMDHLPGIVWQFQSFLLELPVTTLLRLVSVMMVSPAAVVPVPALVMSQQLQLLQQQQHQQLQ